MENINWMLGQSGGSGGGIGFVQIIIFVVVAISIIRTIFTGSVKNPNKKKPSVGGGDSGPSLEEIAERRRRQLQEMAKQRGGGSTSAGAGREPGNLTMAERIARARAKQQYEQRSRQMNEGVAERAEPQRAEAGQPMPSQAQRDPRNPRGAQRPPAGRANGGSLEQRIEQRRREQQQALAKRQEAIAKAKAKRASSSSSSGSSTSRRQPASPPRPVNQPLRFPEPAPLPPAAGHAIGEGPEHDEVHRMVDDASPTVERRSRKASLDFGKISRNDLKRAFILKEVLDRPVSERDAETGVGER